MSAYLITSPNLKGTRDVWLCRDSLPPRWGKKGEYPGAVLVRTYTDAEVVDIDAMERDDKLDLLLAEATHKGSERKAA